MSDQETIFDRWAKERNITVEEMRAILSARIEQGLLYLRGKETP